WRNCLEKGRRHLNRASSAPRSGRSRPLSTFLAAPGVPILWPFRFSKQFRKGSSPKSVCDFVN
ncbi:MAG: hypothetical protein AVDCRST_MAG01-01-4364, partial [uncultured Rubrobacteraceae bacterium]